MHPIVVIPARRRATRLPDKPLAEIAGEPMIVHVWRRAVVADAGPVLVACDDAAVAEAVEAAGGRAVLTDETCASGSDRAHQAVEHLDPAGTHDAVVNLQGDLPAIDPADVRACLDPLADDAVDIATLAAPIAEAGERDDPNVVKVAAGLSAARPKARALYFSRAPIPWNATGEGELHHHIGIYAYRRAALARFVAMPPAPLETREKLEQLRALEAGMRIDVARVDRVPLGVDTPADLARARELLGG